MLPPPNQPSDQPQNPQSNAPMQSPNPLDNQPNPVQPQMPQLSWSYFKPESQDWMETHNFPEEAKVQRFCLTPTGEATLWYETLRPIEVDWTGFQEHFWQQY